MAKNPRKSIPSDKAFKHLIIEITRVRPLGGYRLELTFNDGAVKVVDFWPLLEDRKGLFETLKDRSFFSKVYVDQEAGTITWPNGLDWAPDVLYQVENV